MVTVTLNRPEAKNALSREMMALMFDAWEMINADDDVRVAIITGAGGAFCAGADLKLLAGDDIKSDYDHLWEQTPDFSHQVLLRTYQVRKPLIAAVEGPAVAGGTELLQSTDIRIAGAGARFGLPEVRRGLFPLAGSTVRLRRQISYTWAAELLMTGRLISAEQARDIGLIGHVVPDGTALSKAKNVAREISANGPLAVQAVKRSLQSTAGLPEAEALDVELAIGRPIYETEDALEGPRAFAEKRSPKFSGR